MSSVHVREATRPVPTYIEPPNRFIGLTVLVTLIGHEAAFRSTRLLKFFFSSGVATYL